MQNDWSSYLVKLEQLTKKLTDQLNEQDYETALQTIAECKMQLDCANNCIFLEMQK